MRRIHALVAVAFLALVPGADAASSRSGPAAFVPFGEFLQGVAAAGFESYELRKDAGVKRTESFEAMRRHILSMYEDVSVAHSFVVGEQYFDCVPIAQQPSARRLGLQQVALAPPDPPAGPREKTRPAGPAQGLPSPLTLGRVDPFGNAVSCEEGTIPMRRITLEETSRFETLEKFFRKTPWGDVGRLRSPGKLLDTDPPPPVHYYAYTDQGVKNYGGSSWLNLWSPPIDGSASQIFSLSQHWYYGGHGDALQTLEGGWQAFPRKYDTTESVLFIYWTADNYQETGCYNLDCAAFVQTNRNWYLGGPLTASSTPGGPQTEFQLQWKLTNGKWWLYIQGDGALEAVGYYPVAIYDHGQLARYATGISYGGETVGTSSWPPMGSGAFADQGFGQAAYQRSIAYFDAKKKAHAAHLTAFEPSPECYTMIFTPASRRGVWGSYFYFGGPGGNSC